MKFNPLLFLMSLGAGGVAIMPFVLMQYTIEQGAGLITRSQLWQLKSGFLYFGFEAIMIVFAALHIALTIYLLGKLIRWMRQGGHKKLMEDPLKNATLLAPFISIIMTMNVMIGPVRYFLPVMQDNFQAMMLPAFLFWTAIFIALLWTEIKLLRISFQKGFDIDKINFGWLLHPFALGMLTVVGTGIAAMAQDTTIATTAAFLSLISGFMGVFLLAVKLLVLFKSHFKKEGLPEKQFLPSFLIVIPNITLFAISAFRLSHFMEHHLGFEMGAFNYLVMGLAFAFEIWYLAFGISLLVDYFKKHHFSEFYVTQWGFICPLVAFVVLGSFAHKIVLASPILYWVLVASMAITVVFYIELLIKQFQCAIDSARVTCTG
ncbi:MAG: selenoprotein TsoY [Candidatus Woesearchaeota archaeon]